MKPLRLALSCIGPYVDQVDIDFGRLGEVFLVCGPTGAGKTTLFDAMVYALYGQVPGTRDPADLVSHYADGAGEVFVDFSFGIGQQTWRVIRRPPRVVAKRSGDGTRQLPSEAVLYRLAQPEGPWETVRDKPTEVSERVEALLGLSFDEFTRIILLPQGEFQRFLDMNTSDRTEILEKLFPVDAHTAVTERARGAAQEAKAEAKAADEAIAALVQELGQEPQAGLETARLRVGAALAGEEAARNTLMDARLALETARAAAKAWDELAAAESEQAELLAQRQEMESQALRLGRAVAASGIQAVMEAWDRASEHVRRESSLRGGLASQLEALKARQSEMEQLGLERAELSDSVAAMDREAGDLAARVAAWERARIAGLALSAAEIKAAEAETAAEKSREKIQALEVALAELETGLADRSILSDALAQATESRESARLTVAAATEKETLTAGLAKSEAETLEVSRQLQADEKRLREAEAAVARAEASLARSAIPSLAASLAPGCPCPVCGGLDHPAPALGSGLAEPATSGVSATGEPEDTASLEQTRTALRLAERAVAEERSRLAALDQTKTHANRRLSALAEVPTLPAAQRYLALSDTAVIEARAALTAADTRAAAVTAARNQLETARKEARASEAALVAAGQALASARTAVQEACKAAGSVDPAKALESIQAKRDEAVKRRATIEGLRSAWDADMASAVSRLGDCEQRLVRAESEFAEASATANKALAKAGFPDRESWEAARMDKDEQASLSVRAADYAASVAASEARLAAARRTVEGGSRPDISALQGAATEAEAAHAVARAALTQAESELRGMETSLAALETARGRREALRTRGDQLVELAGLLNGETAGRRLSFRNFVLARYFARVARQASVRLREMSEGRYDLRVVEGKSRGQGRIGLDLEVMDSFTGRARPASSLSGGEKFLTSISLALGLSDVITRRSGGIALDSIFIDEGFGSLDDETLDRAVAVLDRIRGQRVIGIVSHVGELRTRIPARLEVDKTGNGSSLRIIGG